MSDDYLDDVEEDELLAHLHRENRVIPRDGNSNVQLAAISAQLETHSDAIIGLQTLVAELQSSIDAVNELLLKIAIRMDIQ